MMRGGQDSCKNFVGNRLPHKVSPDIPPLENHAVDRRPLILRKSSLAVASDVLTRTHEGSFTRHAMEQPV
jgi:hypothetical protein